MAYPERPMEWPSVPMDPGERTCIQAGPAMGIACGNCALHATLAYCDILEAGIEMRTLREERDLQEQEKLRLLERILNLRVDTLVGTALTPEGLKDYMTHEQGVTAELQQGKWGVVRLDGRFVNYLNKYGNLVGDRFLQAGGAEITAVADGVVRQQPDRRVRQTPVETDRRARPDRRTQPLPPPPSDEDRERGLSLQGDIICRQGGDEFSLIIRNVTPKALQRVALRVQSQLTVTRALEGRDEGRIPFIASVGYAHAEQLDPAQRAALRDGDSWEAFVHVNAKADEGHRRSKDLQYKEMWNTIVESAPSTELPLMRTQPDDRIIAEMFITRFFPDFVEALRPLSHENE